MMFGTAFLLVLERQNALNEGLTAYQFHDWFYFMVVTVATVGFGDVYPRTSQGQVPIYVLFNNLSRSLSWRVYWLCWRYYQRYRKD